MEEVSIKVCIQSEQNSEENNYTGIINKKDNILIYDDKETKTTIEFNKNKLTRENKEMIIEFNFSEQKETKVLIYLKDLKNTLELDLKTRKITINKNKYEVIYIINNEEKYKYNVEILN